MQKLQKSQKFSNFLNSHLFFQKIEMDFLKLKFNTPV